MKTWKAIAWVLLVLALAEFAFRGPLKQAPGRWWDFAAIHTMARAFVDGSNPYDADRINATYLAGPKAQYLPGKIDWLPPVVGPWTLVTMSPFAMMGVGPASYAWNWLCVVQLAGQIWVLVRLAGPLVGGVGRVMLVAYVLAMGTVHIGFLAAQPAVPCIALMVLGVYAVWRQRDVLAGVLLAVATAIKPQLGAPFLVYYLICGRWRVAGWGFGVAMLIVAAAVLRLHAADVPWWGEWLHRVAQSQKAGQVNDAGLENATRYHLVNLQLPFAAMFASRTAARVAATAVFVVLGGWFLWRLTRSWVQRTGLAAMSIVAVLTLMPVYHRYYDATLLCLPAAWAIANLAGPMRRYAVAALVLLAPYLLPLAFARNLITYGLIPAWVESHWWWNVLVASHQAWALVGLAVCLLLAMGNQSKSNASFAMTSGRL